MTDIPPDYDRLRPWFDFLRRIRTTVTPCYPQWVEIAFLIDENGVPVVWTTPQTRRLEPHGKDVTIKD